MRQYNVILAYDDIFQLATDKDIADWRRDDQINIIARANTGTKLREAMKKHIGVVDAVIVDANFDANEIVVDDEKIISGLRRAFDLNRTYNEDERRGIPFFLYTGRTKDILYQACDSDDRKSLKEMFEDTGRWIDKGKIEISLDRLFSKIKEDVDAVNTIDFQLRRRFSDEFNAAELIEDGQIWLLDSLRFEYDAKVEYNDVKQYFNSARGIWEQITNGLKEHKIIPQISTINGVLTYLGCKEVDYYRPIKSIMHPTLWKSLDYFLDITQDGSHKSKDLTYKVIDYVRTSGNVNLHRSITYIVMDLLLWYRKLMENPPQEQLWETLFKDEGEIKEYYNGRYTQYYVASKQIYELKVKKGATLPVGRKVRILDSKGTDYPFFVPEGEVKQVVFNTQYEIIEDF